MAFTASTSGLTAEIESLREELHSVSDDLHSQQTQNTSLSSALEEKGLAAQTLEVKVQQLQGLVEEKEQEFSLLAACTLNYM